MSTERIGDWIQTYTGLVIYPLDAQPEEICIEDIAHALSNICRFTGHCRTFYSVAEHSVRVSYVVPGEDALWGLMHDASEAYLNDMSRPMKRYSEFGIPYRAVEDRLMLVIAERFGLKGPMPESVKHADTVLLMTEKRDLMHGCNKPWEDTAEPLPSYLPILPIVPVEAKEAFLKRFYHLKRFGKNV